MFRLKNTRTKENELSYLKYFKTSTITLIDIQQVTVTFYRKVTHLV